MTCTNNVQLISVQLRNEFPKLNQLLGKIRDKGGNVRPSNPDSIFRRSIEGAKAEEVPNVRRACKIDR